MPVIPSYTPSRTVRRPPSVVGGEVNPFAQTVNRASEVLQKIREGAEESEITRAVGETAARVQDVLTTNVDRLTNPNEFLEQSATAIGAIREDALRTASSERVRRGIDARLADNFIRADTAVRHQYFIKQVEKAQGDAVVAGDQILRAAVTADQGNRDGLLRMYDDMVGRMESSGFIKSGTAAGMKIDLRERVNARRREYFLTGVQDQLDNLTNEVYRLPARVGDLHDRGLGIIAEATAGDLIEPEKINEANRRFREQIYAAAVRGKIDRDPVTTAEELRRGDFDKYLSQEGLRSLRNEADVQINAMIRQMKAEKAEIEREIGEEVKDYKAAVMAGSPWAGDVGKLADRVKGSKHEKEFRHVLESEHDLRLFALMSPAEAEHHLRLLDQQPKTGDQAQLHARLRSALESNKEALKKDPISFAIRQRAIPPLSKLDLNNPVSLQERSIAANLVQQRYGVPASPLSDDEADALRNQLANATPEAQVDVLQKLRRGFEDRHIKSIAAQFARKSDNTLAYVTGLSIDAPQAASEILTGRKVLRDNPKVGLEGRELSAARDRINQRLGDAYKHNSELHGTVTDAILASYAARSWKERDLSGTLSTSRLDAASKAVTGGILTIGGGLFGRGYTIQPPRYGMTEAGFRDLVTKADYSKVKGMKRDDILKQGTFESVGDGRYLVRIGPGYVHNDQGQPFILDLGAVLQAQASGAAAVGGAAGLVQ